MYQSPNYVPGIVKSTSTKRKLLQEVTSGITDQMLLNSGSSTSCMEDLTSSSYRGLWLISVAEFGSDSCGSQLLSISLVPSLVRENMITMLTTISTSQIERGITAKVKNKNVRKRSINHFYLNKYFHIHKS